MNGRAGPWRPGLRVRLTLVATLVVALAVAAAGVTLMLLLRDQLDAAADVADRDRVEALLDQAATGRLPSRIPTGPEDMAQVVGSGGEVLAASANSSATTPVVPTPAGDGPVVTVVRAPDDAETEVYRLWGRSASGPDGPVTAWVGTGVEAAREGSRTLLVVLLIGGPVLLLVLATLVWLVLGRALGRVDRMRAAVDAISGDGDQRIGSRLDEGGAPDEIDRLARTMNRMLGRVEASLVQQRRLVADVSHDLQSPLAAQRATLEVALASGEPLEADDTRALLTITDEMESLVGDLLILESLDALSAGTTGARGGLAGASADLARLDLDDLVLEEADRVRVTSTVVVDTSAVSAAEVRGRPADLRRAVRNLLDNAVSHAASEVRVIVARADAPDGSDGSHGWVEVHVVDDGHGIDPADRERVFDRFVRVEAARSPGRSGTGLGLAIARRVAETHAGTVTVAPEPYGRSARGAHLVLRIPAA